MQITVDIEEAKIANLVRKRIAELFSDDARYRETGVRDMVRRIVDESAIKAVRLASESIAGMLPEMAAKAVNTAAYLEMEAAAKRGLKALSKLYAGFDPSKLTPEQRAWIEKQIVTAAKEHP